MAVALGPDSTKSSSPTLNRPTASRTARAMARARSRLGRSSAKMTRELVTCLETRAQRVARLTCAGRPRRRRVGLRCSATAATAPGFLLAFLELDVVDVLVQLIDFLLQRLLSRGVRRIRQIVH